MSELHGKTGAIYYAPGIIRATTLSFAISPSRILDSANGLVTAGFTQNTSIVVVGSVSNNTTYTIATGGVAAGTLTLTSAPTPESEGPLVTIYQAPAGSAIAGCTEWMATTTCDVHETTDFQDAGIKTFISGMQGWTGTAKRNWQDTDDRWGGSGLGSFQWVRLFLKYVASPSGGNPAYYYEGLAIVTATDINTPNGDLIGQTFNFQGVGALSTLVTRTTSW